MAAFTNTEFAFGGMHHLALTCSDMQRTVDFYTHILGMTLVKTLEFTHDSGRGQHFFFDVGNGRDAIAFFWFDAAPPPPRGGPPPRAAGPPGPQGPGLWAPWIPPRWMCPVKRLRPIATSPGRRALPPPRSSSTRPARAARHICPRSPTRTPLY